MVVAEDASVVTVAEINLHGIVADLRGGLRADFRLVHGECGRRNECGRFRGVLMFLIAFFVAGGAGTFFA